MPTIHVLPHAELCPTGVTFEAAPGSVLIDVLFQHHIRIEHACEMQCACTTCHVYVRTGFDSVKAPAEKEDELLDKAWGLDMDSRLSCQVLVGEKDMIIEIPKYTINMVSEG